MSVNLFDNVRFLTNLLPVAGTWWGRVRVGERFLPSRISVVDTGFREN